MWGLGFTALLEIEDLCSSFEMSMVEDALPRPMCGMKNVSYDSLKVPKECSPYCTPLFSLNSKNP